MPCSIKEFVLATICHAFKQRMYILNAVIIEAAPGGRNNLCIASIAFDWKPNHCSVTSMTVICLDLFPLDYQLVQRQ